MIVMMVLVVVATIICIQAIYISSFTNLIMAKHHHMSWLPDGFASWLDDHAVLGWMAVALMTVILALACMMVIRFVTGLCVQLLGGSAIVVSVMAKRPRFGVMVMLVVTGLALVANVVAVYYALTPLLNYTSSFAMEGNAFANNGSVMHVILACIAVTLGGRRLFHKNGATTPQSQV